VIGTTTPSRQPVLISLNPIAGESVTSRDGLYLRTDVALNCLSAGEGVLGLVEEIIMSLPDDPADPKGAFAFDFGSKLLPLERAVRGPAAG
jgi:hypothetical protein